MIKNIFFFLNGGSAIRKQELSRSCLERFYLSLSQVQHGMGPLINMQKSVFLSMWNNYELYGRKILHIENFSAIEFENLV